MSQDSPRPRGDRHADRHAAEDTVSHDAPAGAANKLFDLRYLIGTLFTFYGLVLTVASFFVSHQQSGDVDINLWLGLGMLVLGVFFLVWARLRPLHLTPAPSAGARAERDD
jgi:hypothetical protein